MLIQSSERFVYLKVLALIQMTAHVHSVLTIASTRPTRFEEGPCSEKRKVAVGLPASSVSRNSILFWESMLLAGDDCLSGGRWNLGTCVPKGSTGLDLLLSRSLPSLLSRRDITCERISLFASHSLQSIKLF